jgi:hypothetical protein
MFTAIILFLLIQDGIVFLFLLKISLEQRQIVRLRDQQIYSSTRSLHVCMESNDTSVITI